MAELSDMQNGAGNAFAVHEADYLPLSWRGAGVGGGNPCGSRPFLHLASLVKPCDENDGSDGIDRWILWPRGWRILSYWRSDVAG